MKPKIKLPNPDPAILAIDSEIKFCEINEMEGYYSEMHKDSIIDSGELPEGWYCYDIRSCDNCPRFATLEKNSVYVNHAGCFIVKGRLIFVGGDAVHIDYYTINANVYNPHPQIAKMVYNGEPCRVTEQEKHIIHEMIKAYMKAPIYYTKRVCPQEYVAYQFDDMKYKDALYLVDLLNKPIEDDDSSNYNWEVINPYENYME